MTIYESGLSLWHAIRGNVAPYKTFVCVLDHPQDYTIEQAFLEMRQYINLELKAPTTKVDRPELSITVTCGDVYTLAHENIYGNKHEQKPSSILRHMMTRFFYVDTIYKDADGEYIDITQRGLKMAQQGNKMLSCLSNDFYTLINKHPEIMVLTIKKALEYDFTLSSNIQMPLESFQPQRHITNFDLLQSVVDQHGVKAIDKLLSFSGVKHYLIESCCMKISTTFAPIPIVENTSTQENYENLNIKNHLDGLIQEHIPVREQLKPIRNVQPIYQ